MRPSLSTVLSVALELGDYANAGVRAQTLGPNTNSTYFDGLIGILNQQNLTSLSRAIQIVSNTSVVQGLLSVISANDAPYTIVAPWNDAFEGVPPQLASDPQFLTQTIPYHIIPGHFTGSNITSYPRSTQFPTLLDNTRIVNHLGGQPQYIGFQNRWTGRTTYVTNQQSERYPAVIQRTTHYENLIIHVISAIMNLPPSMNDLFSGAYVVSPYQNLTLFPYVLSAGNITSLNNEPSLTLFAPIDAAILNTLSSISNSNFTLINQTIYKTIALNHVLNGTIAFTESNSTRYISAAGEPLFFSPGGTHDVGKISYGKNLTANILVPNIITQNGVVHIIDAVLSNSESNATAASTAYPTFPATTSPTPTPSSFNNLSSAPSITPIAYALTTSDTGSLITDLIPGVTFTPSEPSATLTMAETTSVHAGWAWGRRTKQKHIWKYA